MLLCIFAQVDSLLSPYLSRLHNETSAVHKSTQLGYESKSMSQGTDDKVGDQTEDLKYWLKKCNIYFFHSLKWGGVGVRVNWKQKDFVRPTNLLKQQELILDVV